MDITIREKIVFPIAINFLLKAYTEYEDLPGDARIGVYSIDEIAAEKIVALLDPARNEPRDLYDLWYLTANKHVDLAEVTEAVELKMKFRQKELSDVKGGLVRKEVRLRKLWDVRLAAQMVLLPEFDEAYRAVQCELRRTGFLN